MELWKDQLIAGVLSMMRVSLDSTDDVGLLE